MFPRFTAKQNDIIEGLRRGEEVDEIARRLNTTAGNIYNVRSKAKKLGFTINPPQDTTLQRDNAQPEQPQPPLNTDPRPESRTSIPEQPATITQTVTPDHYRENQEFLERLRHIYHIVELQRQNRQVPQPQRAQSAPRSYPSIMDELYATQTRLLNGFIQLLPHFQMLQLACECRKQMERMLDL